MDTSTIQDANRGAEEDESTPLLAPGAPGPVDAHPSGPPLEILTQIEPPAQPPLAPQRVPPPLPPRPGTRPAPATQAIQEQAAAPALSSPATQEPAAPPTPARDVSRRAQRVHGLDDDDLWALVRRFDKQINHVLAPARNTLPTEPDLRVTNLPNVPFRSVTLKSNFERVISAIGPPATHTVKAVGRLADWDAPIRTSAYCTVYFVAWANGYTVALLGAFITCLICFPQTRCYLVPAEPHSHVKDTSLLGVNSDTTGGRCPRTSAEQAEEQAWEARAILEAYTQTVVMGLETEANPDTDSESNSRHSTSPRPRDGDVAGPGPGSWSQTTSERHFTDVIPPERTDEDVVRDEEDPKANIEEVKRRHDKIVARMARKTETGLGVTADYLEILHNALSPPPGYPDHHARFRIAAAVVVAPVLALHFVPAQVWGQLFGFVFGAGFWGYPLWAVVGRTIKSSVPNWDELTDPRNGMLSGTPTNAQLTLHILRTCEDNGVPLPPPLPAPTQGSLKHQALAPSVPIVPPSAGTLSDPATPGVETPGLETPNEQSSSEAKPKKKRFMGVIKTASNMSKQFAMISGNMAVNRRGNQITSKLNDMFFQHKFDTSQDAYACKLGGDKRGHLVINQERNKLYWIALMSNKPQYEWNVGEIDSVDLFNFTVGWIAGATMQSLGLAIRFVPGNSEHRVTHLAAAAAEAAAQAEAEQPSAPKPQPVDITKDKHDSRRRKLKLALEGEGETIYLSGIQRREQLFNRLIAIGQQRWEVL